MDARVLELGYIFTSGAPAPEVKELDLGFPIIITLYIHLAYTNSIIAILEPSPRRGSVLRIRV